MSGQRPAPRAFGDALPSITQSRLSDWTANVSQRGFERLTAERYHFPDHPRPNCPSHPANAPVVSSQTLSPAPLAPLRCGSMAPSIVPSLDDDPGTESNLTVSTSLASDVVNGYDLLVEGADGGLVQQQPEQTRPRAVFECAFRFLSCRYWSEDEEEWKTHCLSHFRGASPPHRVSCPLCNMTFSSEVPKLAWEDRMDHVAAHHRAHDMPGAGVGPDFELYQHLWRKGIITGAELKELVARHVLHQEPQSYSVIQGPTTEERRNRRRAHR